MCGLFGAYGPNLSPDDIEVVKWLGILTKQRGKDSTGIVTVHREPSKLKAKIYRDTSESSEFFGKQKTKELLGSNPFIVAGHCRWATHGSVRISNAHPFSVGHYIGMQNGVMGHLFEKGVDKTDTEILYEHINKLGFEKGLMKGLKDGWGDAALVFINKSNGTLNFFRDDVKPLFMAVDPKGTKFWASQKDYLEFVEKQRKKAFKEIFSLKPYTLNSISMKTLKVDITEIEKPQRVVYKYNGPMYGRSSESKKDDHVDMNACYPASSRITSDTSMFNDKVVSAVGDGCYKRKIIKVRSAEEISPRSQVVGPSTIGPSSRRGGLYNFYQNKRLGIVEASRLTMGTGCGCDFCGKRPRSLLAKLYFFDEKGYLCEDCHGDKKLIDTMYSGNLFWRGGVVSSEGYYIESTKDKDIPF